MKISIDVDLDQMADEVMMAGHEEAMRIILAIDLGIADAGFTEELITKLWDSLCGDFDEDEKANVLALLKKAPSDR